MKRLVRRHDRLLREIVENTREARRTHAVDEEASILGTDEASGSMFDAFETMDDDMGNAYEAMILGFRVLLYHLDWYTWSYL
jgi:hypothetical protein